MFVLMSRMYEYAFRNMRATNKFIPREWEDAASIDGIVHLHSAYTFQVPLMEPKVA